MSPKKLYSFKIDPELADALKRVKERDHIGESEQIRQGLKLWFQKRGIKVKRPTAAPKTRRKG